MHVMLDIETLGRAPNGVLLQVGACAFREPAVLDEPWRRQVQTEDCVRLGMTVDERTLDWWRGQPNETWIRVRKDPRPVAEVLLELVDAYPWPDLEGVWTNAPLFDFAILRDAYERVGIPCPWHYRQERCSRTLLWLVASEAKEELGLPKREGVHHDAGDDARHQAAVALRLLAWARGRG